MSYIALPTKNPTDLLTSALWNTYLQGNADNGFCRMLADTTVAGSAVANITFASIPATFAHLLLVIYGRSTSVTVGTDVILTQFNADVGANYDYYSTASAAGNVAQTSTRCGEFVGGGATAGMFSTSLVLIPHYANVASMKSLLGLISGRWGTTAGNALGSIYAGQWRTTNAAISQILLASASGSIAVGSRATLYGLPS